jgi:predicted nucleic acid-binding protein
MGTLTYIDANVLINAALQKDTFERRRAWEVINDPSRTFLWSNCLKLEVVPRSIHNKFMDQVALYLEFFQSATFIPISDAIFEDAQQLAAVHGLSAMDALHIACAKAANADEFVTFEKPDKPFFRIPPSSLKVTTLYTPPQPAQTSTQ